MELAARVVGLREARIRFEDVAQVAACLVGLLGVDQCLDALECARQELVGGGEGAKERFQLFGFDDPDEKSILVGSDSGRLSGSIPARLIEGFR